MTKPVRWRVCGFTALDCRVGQTKVPAHPPAIRYRAICATAKRAHSVQRQHIEAPGGHEWRHIWKARVRQPAVRRLRHT